MEKIDCDGRICGHCRAWLGGRCRFDTDNMGHVPVECFKLDVYMIREDDQRYSKKKLLNAAKAGDQLEREDTMRRLGMIPIKDLPPAVQKAVKKVLKAHGALTAAKGKRAQKQAQAELDKVLESVKDVLQVAKPADPAQQLNAAVTDEKSNALDKQEEVPKQ